MNVKSLLAAALVAGLAPVAAVAQAAPAASAPAAPAAPTATAPVAPSAYPAKIALVNFIEAVEATNEGQRSAQEVMSRFQPQKQKLDALAGEIDALKKKLQAAPKTMTDEERNSLLKQIDVKDKDYQNQTQDAQTAYNGDLQDALGKVAQKVHKVLLDYVQKNGYTILLNINQQSDVMWTSANPNADITEALVEAYNAQSGVAAPAPSAPAPTAKPKAATPHTTTPRSTTQKPQ